MEFVNIKSIKTAFSGSEEDRKKMIEMAGNDMPADHVITTDQLELLNGEDLIEKAVSENIKYLPLKTVNCFWGNIDFPDRVILELTSKCNSNCTMCPRNIIEREDVHMDTKVLKGIITQLGEVGLRSLLLYNIGESLLHPDFFELLDHCRSYDNLGTLWLSTNGEIMDGDMCEKILSNPPDILNYSLNAMSAVQYKKLSPNFNFAVIKKNLIRLLAMKKEAGALKPIIRAQMIAFPHQENEIEEFKGEFGDKADVLSINRLEVFSKNSGSKSGENENDKNKYISRCNRIERKDFFICSNGFVTCCDTDVNSRLEIGNVLNQTIKEIYDGEKYQELIKQYREGRLHENDVCSVCEDYDL